MIYAAIKYLRDELNAHLIHLGNVSTDIVLLDSIHESDGSISPKITDKLVVSLVNVERVSVQGRSPVSVTSGGESFSAHSAPLNLNVHVLVAARFTNYAQSLTYLSRAAAFLQARAQISSDASNTLPDGIEKLDIQLENMSTHELSNLWGMMGGKHFPALMYRMRMITVNHHDLIRELPGITQPSTSVSS